MWKIGAKAALLTLCVDMLFYTHLASGSFPRAQNVTWRSINFKTLLMWGPKPSEDYSYTVEYSVIYQNREQNPHCIRSRDTMCDLTGSLRDVRKAYIAEVLSEPPRGVTSDLVEYPHTRSEPFCPYNDTDIDKPDFKIKVGKDNLTLYVTDPPTALFEENRQMSIRDVFGEALQYKVTYRRASSTGKTLKRVKSLEELVMHSSQQQKQKQKEHISKSSEINVPSLDQGESYCFEVQAYIPSRPSTNKQLGALSHTQCSEGKRSFTDEYSVPVIAGGVLLILALVGVAIGLIVVCCRRQSKRAQKKEKEGAPLQKV